MLDGAEIITILTPLQFAPGVFQLRAFKSPCFEESSVEYSLSVPVEERVVTHACRSPTDAVCQHERHEPQTSCSDFRCHVFRGASSGLTEHSRFARRGHLPRTTGFSVGETFSTRRQQPAPGRGGRCCVYNDFLPAALALAHRALAAADSLARAFALTFLLTLLEAGLPLRLTRPAFPVTPTLARADILLLPRRVPAEVTEEETPKM